MNNNLSKKWAVLLVFILSFYLILSSIQAADVQSTENIVKETTEETAPQSSPAPTNVNDILQKSDEMMRGTTSQGEYEMIVKTKRWKRTMRMNYWSQGTEKSFVLVTYPARDKGTTFLKLKNEMWQYVPKIERTIKIPPSMMMQSWMGSDFTNDDLVKESSIVEDYDGKILSQDNTSWKIELIPKEEAAVAWGKVIVWIDKKTYLPTKEDFYDEEGVLVRIMRFEDVKKSGNRYYPEKMYLEPQTEDKEGNSTTFIVKSIVFDEPIKEGLFSLKSLKSMSK